MLENLIVFALESESQKRFDDYPVLYTGVGKVNAAYHLTRAIVKKRPQIVINLGTAGSQVFETGSLVCCDRFVQRDIDVSPLGFEKYETPYSNRKIIFQYGQTVDFLPAGICGTGDCFDTSFGDPIYQLVDMEAYALAQVCHAEKIPFLCIKYISDGADGESHQDWRPSLDDASVKLREILDRV